MIDRHRCVIKRRELGGWIFSVASIVVSHSGEISEKLVTHSVFNCSSGPMTACGFERLAMTLLQRGDDKTAQKLNTTQREQPRSLKLLKRLSQQNANIEAGFKSQGADSQLTIHVGPYPPSPNDASSKNTANSRILVPCSCAIQKIIHSPSEKGNRPLYNPKKSRLYVTASLYTKMLPRDNTLRHRFYIFRGLNSALLAFRTSTSHIESSRFRPLPPDVIARKGNLVVVK